MALDSLPVEHLFTLVAETGDRPPAVLPATPSGTRIVITAMRGRFDGPKLNGTIADVAGGDWVTRRADGTLKLDVRLVLATVDGVVQQVLNGMVDVQSDDSSTASGRWHLQEHLRRTDGQAALLLAHYDDRYVHRGDRWRFASRTLVTHYQGPADLSGHFTINEGIV